MPVLPVGEGGQGADGPEACRAKSADSVFAKIAALQAEMLKDSRWVGDEFTDTARAMHSGDIEPAPVHGNATLAQAKSLADDGVPVAPLPLPVVPPTQVN